jgi:surface carbohydrate biosynthesis protein (TIGR04326 family)
MKNKSIKKLFIKHKISNQHDKKSILWTGYEETQNQKSILLYIKNNSKELRSNYLSWIDSIGNTKINNIKFKDYLEINSGFSLWWMTHFAEKSHTKTRSHYSSIKFLALIDILNKWDMKTIICEVDNINLQRALESYCREKEIIFNPPPYSLKYKIDNFKIYHIFKGLVLLIRGLLRHLFYKKVKRNPDCFKKNSVSFFSYLLNFEINNNEFYSTYWTSLPNYLNNKNVKINWFHHYLKSKETNNINDGIQILKKLNNDNNAHNLIYNQIPLIRFFKLLFIWFSKILKISIIEKKLFNNIDKSKNGFLFNFHIDDYYNSIYGSLCIQNIIWAYQFELILKKIPRQELGLYLCENQGWERALCYYWEKNGHGNLCGVIHSTMPFWDLRYFQDQNYYNKDNAITQPNYYAINSPIAKKLYLESFQPKNKLVEVEALRYFGLVGSKMKIKEKNKTINELIVIGDYQKNTTIQMLRILNNYKKNNDVEIIFKPHPGNIIDLDQNGLNGININNDSIQNLSKRYDYFITTANTSSSIDLILLRKNFLVYLDQDDFNLSYLNELKNIDYFYDNQSFDKLISSLPKNLNTIDPNQLLYLDPSLKKWKDFINDNFNSFE